MQSLIILLIILLADKAIGRDVISKAKFLSESQILDEIRLNPKFGDLISQRFSKEAKLGWRTMKSRYVKLGFKDPVNNDVWKSMYNTVFQRLNDVAEILPPHNQQEIAMTALKVRSESDAQKARDQARKRQLLCAVFLSSADLPVLYGNLDSSNRQENGCDWSVTFFAGRNDLITKFIDDVGAGRYPRVVHATNYTGPRAASGTIFVPKPALYLTLLPLTKAYKRVWILDADISLESFSFTRLFRVLDCEFAYDKKHSLSDVLQRRGTPRGPIISQPVVADDTQFFPTLNAGYWNKSGLGIGKQAKFLAQQVRIIEQQMPIFQADFFEWYVDQIMRPWVPVSLVLEATWGFDTTWCGAAEDYALFRAGESTLGANYYSKYNVSRPAACAVLLATHPVRHLKKVTGSQMITKHGNAVAYATFYFTGHMQKFWVHDRLPSWSAPNRRGLPNASRANLVPRSTAPKNCPYNLQVKSAS